MSYITNVLVQGSVTKEIQALNEWLREADTERTQQFQQINMDSAGGTKWYVVDVWAAAFNYGPMEELLAKLRDPATWGTAVRMVAVIIDGEEESEAFVFDNPDGSYKPVTRAEPNY